MFSSDCEASETRASVNISIRYDQQGLVMKHSSQIIENLSQTFASSNLGNIIDSNSGNGSIHGSAEIPAYSSSSGRDEHLQRENSDESPSASKVKPSAGTPSVSIALAQSIPTHNLSLS